MFAVSIESQASDAREQERWKPPRTHGTDLRALSVAVHSKRSIQDTRSALPRETELTSLGETVRRSRDICCRDQLGFPPFVLRCSGGDLAFPGGSHVRGGRPRAQQTPAILARVGSAPQG